MPDRHDPSKPTVLANGFLFDLDGVLTDSTKTVERHWHAFAMAFRLDPADVLQDVHGRRAADVIRDHADRLTIPVDEAIAAYEQSDIEDQEDVTLQAGARETLTQLPPNAWTVVTSGTLAVARARLRAVQLPEPATFVTADDVPVGKPAPDPYLLGAARLGIPASQLLAIEDAPNGLASARAAGCRTLALLTTHTTQELSAADVIVRDLSAVTLALRKPAA